MTAARTSSPVEVGLESFPQPPANALAGPLSGSPGTGQGARYTAELRRQYAPAGGWSAVLPAGATSFRGGFSLAADRPRLAVDQSLAPGGALARSSWPFAPLRPLNYDVIVADPPWPYEVYSPAGEKKSYAAHYRAMPLAEISALPAGHLARIPCLLLLWAISPMLPQALDVMRAWGFAYKSHLVWRKTTAGGKVRMGTGYRVRSCHEPVLLGTLGNPHHSAFPSLFDGLAREHSRKPEEFYALVDKHCPHGPRVDLFSRQSRPGWDSWGDEAGKFDPVVSYAAGEAADRNLAAGPVLARSSG